MIDSGPRGKSGPEPGTTRQILVVQEDPHDALRTAQCIQEMGHLVACLSDPVEAAGLVAIGSFDMIIVEWPHGREVVATLRRVSDVANRTRVILLTSPPTVEQVIEAHEHGKGLVLSKPVPMDSWAKFVGEL